MVAPEEYPTCDLPLEDVVDTGLHGTGKPYNDVPLVW